MGIRPLQEFVTAANFWDQVFRYLHQSLHWILVMQCKCVFSRCSGFRGSRSIESYLGSPDFPGKHRLPLSLVDGPSTYRSEVYVLIGY